MATWTASFSNTGSGVGTSYAKITVQYTFDAANNRYSVTLNNVQWSNSNAELGNNGYPLFGRVSINSTVVADYEGNNSGSSKVSGSAKYPNYGTANPIRGISSAQTIYVANGGSVTVALSSATSAWTSSGLGVAYNSKLYSAGTGNTSTTLPTVTSTLTVDPNGGSWEGSSSAQNFSQQPTTTKSIANPTRTGYTFTGWTLTGGGTLNGTTYTFGGSNGTLTANWSINSYAVTLTAGDHIASTTGSGTYNYNTSVTATAVLDSATGYTYAFDGWYAGDTKVSGDNPYTFTMLTSAVSLTAKGTRTANSYTVHFDAKGGSGTMADESFTYDQAQALTANSFTRTGYTFLGWDTNSAGTTVVYTDGQSVSNLAASGTITLYAVWSLNTYALSTSATHSTVTVNRTSSPIGGGATGNLSNGATLYYNDTLTITFTAATGYTQATHTVNGTTFTSGSSHTVTANVAVVSTATANTYSVVFNPNRPSGYGGGTMANQGFTYDVAQQLTKNDFTRYYTIVFDANGGTVSGESSQNIYCTFRGWGKTTTDGVQYTDQQSVSNLTAVAGGTVNLYAKWNYNMVTLPSATRTGYTFKGWYTEPTGGTKIGNAGASLQVSSSGTMYAQWEAITFTLSLTSSDTGVVVNVIRTASPIGGGASGLLNNGATLYYGDALSITYLISQGYQKSEATVNGVDFGDAHSGSKAVASVTSSVAVVVTVELGAIVYIGNEAYQAFIWDGTSWVQYEAFIGNGTTWDAY